MQKTFVGSIAALTIAAGSVTGAGTAAAAGLPLDAAAPRTVQDASTGSAAGHESSGSSLSGPISSGSAEVFGSLLLGLAAILGGNPSGPPL